MFKKALLGALCCVVCTGSLSTAAEEPPPDAPPAIKWSDLLPDLQIEDPYARLTTKQLQDLAHVARVRKLLAADKLKAGGTDAKEIAKMESRLAKEGLDVDLLLSLRDQVRRLREIQIKAVQPKLEGKVVRLAGFVVPLETSGERVIQFLLVPNADACSHSIPPPSNQTVFVASPTGVTVVNRVTAVRVTGRIQAKQTQRNVLRTGGQTQVVAAYTIAPHEIETHGSPPSASTAPQRNGTR